MATLDDYFKPDGVWNPSFGHVADLDEEVRRCLADPWNALKPFWDPSMKRTLQRQGIRPAELAAAARVGLDAIVQVEIAAERLDVYEAAVACLLLESLIGNDDVLPIAELGLRQRWLHSLDPRGRPGSAPNFAEIKGIAPAALLRLAAHVPALRSAEPRVRDSASIVVQGAIVRARGSGAVGVEAKVRLVLLRCLTLSSEADDLEDDPKPMLEAVGLARGEVERLIEEIRSERGLEGLTAVGGHAIDLMRLNGMPKFRESAAWYGFRFDPESFQLLREIASRHAGEVDPCIRLLLGMAMDSGDRAGPALAEVRQSGVERVLRPAAIDFVAARRVLTSAEIAALLGAELSAYGESLEQRLFRALVEHRLLGRHEDLARSLDATGLERWFAECWDGYRRSGAGGRAARIPDETLSRMVRSREAWATLPPVDRFAAEIAALAEEIEGRLDRAAAREAGREWLHDFLLTCVGRSPEHYDRGRGIFIDEDRVKLTRMLELRQRQQPRWWGLDLDAREEMRIRESAARDVRSADPELERIAAENARMIAALCSSVRPERLEAELERCVSCVVHGGSGVRDGLLGAFRRGDAAEFREQLDPPIVELPPKRRHRGIWGRRVGVYAAFVLAIPVLMLWRSLFGGTVSTAPATVPVASTAGLGDVLDPAELRWVVGQPGQVWVHSVRAEDLRAFFGDGVLIRQPQTRGSARCTIGVAREFVRRYGPWLEAHHPAGIQLTDGIVVPWEEIGVRMRRSAGGEGSSQAADRPVWLEDGKILLDGRILEAGRFAASASGEAFYGEEASIDVIIERRK